MRWHEKRTSLGAFIDMVFLLGKNSFSLKPTVLSHFPIPVDLMKMHAACFTCGQQSPDAYLNTRK